MSEISNLPNLDFQSIRDEIHIPREFPPAVLAEAEKAAHLDPRTTEFANQYTEMLEVPFITLDPPGSRDLDQAFFMERRDDGYFVRYAIADVGFFVKRGGEIEREAWRRGQTVYSPDLKTPLYPPALSEGGASLLPDAIRPAVVFSFTLNARAEVIALEIVRAIIQSRAQLAYPEVSQHLAQERNQPGSGALNGQEWSASLDLLEEVGRQRQRIEAERGGVSLRIPAQQVQRWTTAVSGYRLAFETASEVEDWNAQISLMTGMGAARTMMDHGVGLLRSLSRPRPDRLQALRLTANALGVRWPAEMDYDDFIRSLDPLIPLHAVILHQAARISGSARYIAFEGIPPTHAFHSALAAFYAHTTAPLRRLADRYVLDLLVAQSTSQPLESEMLSPLPELPQVMSQSDNLAHRLESAIVDCVEAQILQDRIGENFQATVIALRVDGVVVQITDPPIRTLLPAMVFAHASQPTNQVQVSLSNDGTVLHIESAEIQLGQTLLLRLDTADSRERSLMFSLTN